VGISVYWDNAEKTILRQDYSQMWEWHEYEASFAQIRELASEVDHPIGIIADLGSIGRIPPDAIMHGSRAVRELPDNVSLCVVVTPSQLVMTLLRAIRAATRYEKIRVAGTIEDARLSIQAANKISGAQT
jgi:hypothetical protein